MPKLSLNPKHREVSSINGEVGHLCVTCNVIPSALKRALVWNDYETYIEGEKVMKETQES